MYWKLNMCQQNKETKICGNYIKSHKYHNVSNNKVAVHDKNITFNDFEILAVWCYLLIKTIR